MISRTTNADRPEPLQQGSLTGMHGIDYTKPITANNVVNDMRNLTVNTDGTLSIRKPLIAKRTYTTKAYTTKACTAVKVISLYDSEYTLVIYENNSFSIESVKKDVVTKHSVSFYCEKVDYSGTFEMLAVPNVNGVYDVSGFMDVTNASGINTTSNTVLGNVTIDLTSTCFNDENLYDESVIDAVSAKKAFRYVHITKENTIPVTFKLTIKVPEINTLNTGSSLILDPNLSLDYPYAIRDIYNSRYVSIDGILPYTHCKSKDEPTKTSTVSSEKCKSTVNTERSYSTMYTDITSAALPYNPTSIEFLVSTNAFTGYADDYNFYRYGGIYRIWLNNFIFQSTFENEIAHNMCTLKPKSVTVKYTATMLGSGNNGAVEAQIAEPYGVRGGFKVSNTVTYSNNIERDVKGYYVDVVNVPVLHHLITANSNERNGIYHYNSYNYTTTYPNCAGSIVYNGTTKTYEYFCASMQDNAYYRFSNGVGIIDLTIEVTPEYEIDGKFLKYTTTSYVNVFKHFKSDYSDVKSKLIVPWFDMYSPIAGNYPAHIFTSSSVITNDFEAESITPYEETKFPYLEDYPTAVHTTFNNTERVTFNEVSKTNTSYANYKYTSAKITYTECDYEHIVKTDVNVALKNYSPSVKAEVSVSLNNATPSVHNLTFKQDNVSINTENSESPANITLFVTTVISEGGVVFENISNYTIKEITERKQFPKFQLTDVLKADTSNMVLLKAFMNLKNTSEVTYYGVWEYSKDGVDWHSYYTDTTSSGKLEAKNYLKKLKLPKYTVSENGDITVSEDTTLYSEVYGIPFSVKNEKDLTFVALDANADVIKDDAGISYVIPARADVLLLQHLTEEEVAASYCIPANLPIQAIQIKFTVCSISDTDEDTVNVLATGVFTPNTGLKWEFAESDVGNSVAGSKLYHKNTIYSYGHPTFNCNILASDVGSFITPISRIIDVSSNAEDIVTSLIPWRDYLIAFTEHDVHLITSVDNGFYTKTVSTFVGVPVRDSKTCKSILNGIVFKSGNKFYSLYPNYASSDESILNLNEISSPIDHILENLKPSSYNCFSISTNSAYYTFIPYENYTLCVIYNYDNKAWQIYEYNKVRIVDYHVDNVDNIYLYGYCNGEYTEYYFDKYLHEAMPELKDNLNLTTFDEIPYGDYTTPESLKPGATGALPQCTPIVFKLDTGQRIDNISTTKQFVETKVILATQSEKPASNLKIDVYVDGTPVKTRTKGGGIFYKTSPSQVLTFGDVVVNDSDSVLDTVTQAYLKYSGKGKTVRHVIEGESLYDFKLYELFYRYRIMPNKP